MPSAFLLTLTGAASDEEAARLTRALYEAVAVETDLDVLEIQPDPIIGDLTADRELLRRCVDITISSSAMVRDFLDPAQALSDRDLTELRALRAAL